jgi:RecA/RadA recombinase
VTDAEKVKRDLLKKRKRDVVKDSDYLSTGSTLVNLACTGRVDGGFCKGKYFFVVGDSASGKTFLSLTCLAEAAVNPEFDGHRFIYDGGEDGALMDLEKFFGRAVAERIETPISPEGEPGSSATIEEFYFNVDDAIRNGRPFIYIQDSMDCLSSEAEGEKFDERKQAHRKGRESAGSYGDGKAKANSANIRRLLGPLRKSGSILIVLNQTRDNLGFGFEKKTRSGGHALRFYATVEIWSSVKGRITRTVQGKKRQVGTNCLVKVKKNRFNGREREVVVPIYHSHGIDDVGSMVDWLVDEGVWKKSKSGIIEAAGMGPTVKLMREPLVALIEERDSVEDLRELVGETWSTIERQCEVKRRRRYE